MRVRVRVGVRVRVSASSSVFAASLKHASVASSTWSGLG